MFKKKAGGFSLGSSSVSELQSQTLAKVWPLAGDVPLNTPMELVYVPGKLQFAQARGRLEGCGNENSL